MENAGPAAPELEQLLISVRDVQVVPGAEGVIGRGALGEVRRGATVVDNGADGTRQIQLALKGLHMLRTDAEALAAMGGALDDHERAAVLQTFWKECALLHRAKHKNIVAFVGVVVDDTERREPLYIASEFVESGTLHELIYGARHAALRSDCGFLPLATQLVALEGLFAALEYLSSIPLIHRDIKPANVLVVVEDGQLRKVLVADFGEAKQLTQTMTRAALAGTQAGTPLYMAPEMKEADEEKGPKADVFSAGVLAIEMNVQRAPNPGPELAKEGRRRVVVPEEQRRAADIAAVRHAAVAEVVRLSVVDDESERADATALHAFCAARLADAQPPAQFKLFVKAINGSVIITEVTSDTTIGQLKLQVIDQIGQHRLLFAGRQLENDRKIGDYNLLDGTTVHLTAVVSNVARQESERREQLERENAQLHAQVEEAQARLNSHTQNHEARLTAAVADAVSQERERREQLERENAQLHAQVEEAQARLNAHTQNHEARLTAAVADAVSQERERREQLERENAQLHAQVEEAQAQLDTQKQDFTTRLARDTRVAQRRARREAAAQAEAKQCKTDRALAFKDAQLLQKEQELALLRLQMESRPVQDLRFEPSQEPKLEPEPQHEPKPEPEPQHAMVTMASTGSIASLYAVGKNLGLPRTDVDDTLEAFSGDVVAAEAYLRRTFPMDARDAAQAAQESHVATDAPASADTATSSKANLAASVQPVSVSEIDVSIEVGAAVESPTDAQTGSGSLRLEPVAPQGTPRDDLSTSTTGADEKERKAAQRAAKAAMVREAKLRRRAEKEAEKEAAKERLIKHASGEVSPDAAPIEDLTPKSASMATAKAAVRNEGVVGASGATRVSTTDGPGKLTIKIIEAQGLIVPLLRGLDPYVALTAAGTTVHSSNVPVADTTARWSETKSFDIPAGQNVLLFELMDKKRWGNDVVLGQKEVRLQQVREQGEISEILPLISPDGASAPKLQIRMRFERAQQPPAVTMRPPLRLEANRLAAGQAAASAIAIADGIIADTDSLMVCNFGAGRLGLGFHPNSVPPLAIKEVDATALASNYPGLVPGCVLRTVQGQAVTGMPYDDVLALIKQSRPAGPTELAFSRPALETGDDEL